MRLLCRLLRSAAGAADDAALDNPYQLAPYDATPQHQHRDEHAPAPPAHAQNLLAHTGPGENHIADVGLDMFDDFMSGTVKPAGKPPMAESGHHQAQGEDLMGGSGGRELRSRAAGGFMVRCTPCCMRFGHPSWAAARTARSRDPERTHVTEIPSLRCGVHAAMHSHSSCLRNVTAARCSSSGILLMPRAPSVDNLNGPWHCVVRPEARRR